MLEKLSQSSQTQGDYNDSASSSLSLCVFYLWQNVIRMGTRTAIRHDGIWWGNGYMCIGSYHKLVLRDCNILKHYIPNVKVCAVYIMSVFIEPT